MKKKQRSPTFFKKNFLQERNNEITKSSTFLAGAALVFDLNRALIRNAEDEGGVGSWVNEI